MRQMATRNSLCVALKKASLHGHVDVVRLLLSAGADVTARDENGDSQAHFAVLQSVYFTATLYCNTCCNTCTCRCTLRIRQTHTSLCCPPKLLAISKNLLKPAILGDFRSFKVIDVGTRGKLVGSACYDTQQVCVYLQPFSR